MKRIGTAELMTAQDPSTRQIKPHDQQLVALVRCGVGRVFEATVGTQLQPVLTDGWVILLRR